MTNISSNSLSGNSDKPSVALGIVTYNRKYFLEQSLLSVLTHGEFIDQIIVVDDGSSDGTIDLLRSVSDPRLCICQHEQNRGRAAARNTALQHANCDYLIWLDDDDRLLPDAIAHHLEAAGKMPDADVIYGNWIVQDLRSGKQADYGFSAVEEDRVLMALMYEDVIPNGGTMTKRSLFSTVGPYEESYERAEDYHFWVRAALAGARFHYHPHPMCLVSHHDENLANPRVNERHGHFHCNVVKYALKNAKIEELFPILPWHISPDEALANALSALAKIFFDHGDLASARNCVDQSLEAKETLLGQLVNGFVLQAEGNRSEPISCFESVLEKMGAPLLESERISDEEEHLSALVSRVTALVPQLANKTNRRQ